MKKYLSFFFLSGMMISAFCGKATLIKVEGMIDNGIAFYIERSIQTAKDNNSEVIIFEINTFGGRVDSATKIKDDILNSPIQTVAYINKRAISAGALIALSCKKIVMADGSSIGAAAVVDQAGEKQSEKTQSYFRSEIGSTAEINGRNKEIAKAMVDEDIEIEGISEKGKLLTLTSNEAFELGMCDTIVHTDDQLYSYLGISSSDVSVMTISLAERIVRFLTNPIISSLLMTLAFLGLIFEVKTAGWGVGGTVGIIALILFFGSHYIINLADHIEIIIFLVGLILLLLEIFVIPGFGLAGILGILAIFTSFFMTLIGDNPSGDDLMNAGATLSSSFILSIIGIYFMTKYLPDSKFLDFIIIRNQEEKGSGVKTSKHLTELTGKSGIASTDLRLSGKIEIENIVYQAISANEYINSGEKVKVSKVEGNKVIVIKNEE
ncbi:MAG: nodulation protein NfeD [Candidatus Delongbacteria bacterium]|nr:nodulation protein NfeD [Candidatus Delongbacteria bacterium]MCG2761541.1 nodulation protein NfeD [Candidatus Delongbacteria bacterium]